MILCFLQELHLSLYPKLNCENLLSLIMIPLRSYLELYSCTFMVYSIWACPLLYMVSCPLLYMVTCPYSLFYMVSCLYSLFYLVACPYSLFYLACPYSFYTYGFFYGRFPYLFGLLYFGLTHRNSKMKRTHKMLFEIWIKRN